MACFGPRVARLGDCLVLFALTTVLLQGACSQPDNEAPTVTVFAAASTSEAMTRLAKRFEASYGVRVRLSLAASSTLARQIEQGAQADLFISADELWMQYLEDRLLLVPGSTRTLLTNRLALIAPIGSQPPVRLADDFPIDQAFSGRLALADPGHVPAGRYAEQALRDLGWWDCLEARLAPANNVRSALRWVALEECALGIVYLTDAASDPKVALLGLFPETRHDPIRYPVALCRDASLLAIHFYSFLFSSEARLIFSDLKFAYASEPSRESVAKELLSLMPQGE